MTFRWFGSKTDLAPVLSPAVDIPQGNRAFDFVALLRRFLELRKDSTCEQLFNHSTKSGFNQPLKADTIRSRCRYHMNKAGIDTSVDKPYSIRHASASSMVKNGISIEAVLKLGRWKTLSTFLKYYLRTNPKIDVVGLLTDQNIQVQNDENALVDSASEEARNRGTHFKKKNSLHGRRPRNNY